MNLIASLVNLSLIYESLKKQDVSCRIHHYSDSSPTISGIQFLTPDIELLPDILYISRDIPADSHFTGDGSALLIFGACPQPLFSRFRGILTVDAEADHTAVINLVQSTLTYYQHLESKTWQCLNDPSVLNQICHLLHEHFNQSAYIHDTYYNILAYQISDKDCPHFDYDSRSNRYKEKADVLQSFRTSREYKKTLSTVGGQFWCSDLHDGDCLYVNIWIEGRYRGRLILENVENSPGNLWLTTWFGKILERAIPLHYIRQDGENDLLQRIITDSLNGVFVDRLRLCQSIQALGWQENDRYACGLVSFFRDEFNQLTVFALCSDIQKHLPEAYTCYIKNQIYMIVNLTYSQLSLQDLRMRLSVLIREYMLHVGISNEFFEISEFPSFFHQAEIAVQGIGTSRTTSWYREFGECALNYWLLHGAEPLDDLRIAHPILHILRHYDQNHGTDLYKTLQIYLENERSATLTALKLKIHRSTLPHRLEKIDQLTGLNLEDSSTRLYLLMSFALLEDE